MNHLELHMLQSVPVSCLNRDDLNSPKTAIFGGVQRARVSSQCWKQVIREMCREIQPELFKGNRTRRMVSIISKGLVQNKISKPAADAIAEKVGEIIETLDSKKDSEGYVKIKTLMFFSEAEYNSIIKHIVSSEEVQKSIPALESVLQKEIEISKQNDNEKKVIDKEKEKIFKEMNKILEKGPLSKAIKSVQLKDAADIAFFGRMVANDPSLKEEGAAMFSHAISTHKADNEIDFFTAVDDSKGEDEDAGAGMMGTLEFNSATYYRFAALNLDMLADESHLSAMSPDDRKLIVETFIKSTLMAMPGARKGSMNGYTLPGYVMCVVRSEGHPIQLVNAFEKPVNDKNGVFDKSVELLKAEYNKLKTIWGLNEVAKIEMKEVPDDKMTYKTLTQLLEEVLKHVK